MSQLHITPLQHQERIPELDGLRGVAIISVILFHSSVMLLFIDRTAPTVILFRMLSLGWSGVDLFFVLSGFLITSILVRSKTKSRYFYNFYGRRILRIFPLYYVCLTALLFVVIPFFDAETVKATQNKQLWYYAYLHNWLLAWYILTPSAYLSHLWSLAIEEQFYLIWPFIVWILQRKYVLYTALSIAFLTPICRILEIIIMGQSEDILFYIYYSTFTRIDSLMIGAFVALLLQSSIPQHIVSKSATYIGLVAAMLVFVIFFSDSQWPSWKPTPMITIGFSLIGILSGSIIISSILSPETSLIRRILKNKTLKFYGKYSYAMYIFHQPVLYIIKDLFIKYHMRGFMYVIFYVFVTMSLTVLAALLSWQLLEKHMLAVRHRFF